MMLSSQLIHFIVNPLKDYSSDHFKVKISLLDFAHSQNLLDCIKVKGCIPYLSVQLHLPLQTTPSLTKARSSGTCMQLKQAYKYAGFE